ncbi:MAG: hypothetical protein Q8M40_06510 [Legionella sp.]|nr:hypothetical protein [Legionella sp.]
MSDYQLGEQVWIISFEIEDDFYLLSKQTITEIMPDQIECEDDFNTFHVAYEDVYKSKTEAFNVMIDKLQRLRDGVNN